MKNMKFWRTALVATLVLTVMLSVTGGTIAWFTDTVTSEANTISAGNLDIVLEVGTLKQGAEDTANPNSYDWVEVTKDTQLFKDYELYEPGYVETVAFRVRNNGSLALKYNLGTTINGEIKGVNVYGEEFALSDYLKAVTAPGLAYASYSRSVLMGLAEDTIDANGIQASVAKLGEDLHNDVALNPGEAKWYTMAIVMPTTVGNEANHNGTAPQIKLGVSLMATQHTKESDAFGSDYDAGAEYLPLTPSDLPKSEVTAQNIAANPEAYTFATKWPDDPNNIRTLDLALMYSGETYEEAQNSPYAKWHADFEISFDKNLPANAAGIAGSYGTYGWWGFDIDEEMIEGLGYKNGYIPANEEIRLLDLVGGKFAYEDVCLLVKDFLCGAYAIADENGEYPAEGIAITVNLCLYEADPDDVDQDNTDREDETDKRYVVSSYTYTFGE